MALIYDRVGERRRALSMVRKAMGLEPAPDDIYEASGKILNRLEEWGNLVEEYRTALNLAPDLLKPRLGLALSLFHMGRLDEAREEFLYLAENNPEFAGAHLLLGNLYAVEGNHDRALEAFASAIRLEPKSPEAYYDAACVESIRGNTSRALKYLRKAVRYGGDIYRHHASKDKDLANMSRDPRFLELIE